MALECCIKRRSRRGNKVHLKPANWSPVQTVHVSSTADAKRKKKQTQVKYIFFFHVEGGKMARQRSCQQRAPSDRSQKFGESFKQMDSFKPPRMGDQGSRLIGVFFLYSFFFLKRCHHFPSSTTLNPPAPPHTLSHRHAPPHPQPHPQPRLPPVCIHSAAVGVRAAVETRFPARARKMAFLHAGFVYDDGCVGVRLRACACAHPAPPPPTDPIITSYCLSKGLVPRSNSLTPLPRCQGHTSF